MYYWTTHCGWDYKPSDNHTIFCEFLEARGYTETFKIITVKKENTVSDIKKVLAWGSRWDWAISHHMVKHVSIRFVASIN
jgi:hypothetical protein